MIHATGSYPNPREASAGADVIEGRGDRDGRPSVSFHRSLKRCSMSQRLIDATIAEAEKDDRLGSGPDTKFAIAPIIIALVPVIVDLIKKCTSDPASVARSPGLLRRWKLRGEIEKLVPGNDSDSREVREQLFQSVLAAGKTATPSDFE